MRLLAIAFLLGFRLVAAEAPHPGELPPMPPAAPSPLGKFRSWLLLGEGEREQALAGYAPEKQKVLREKLRAYGALPAAQRDRRLDMLELRWYLRPLMSLPAGARAAQLAAVPAPWQPMVMDRLGAWDRLAEETRAELLASEEARELAMAYFAQIRRGVSQNLILGRMPEAQRAELQRALASWSRTPPAELDRKANQMAAFFETGAAEQAKTLAVLNDSEQAEIQRTLDAFARLPAAQRRACVRSFQRFAALSAEERGQFLRNAARWREMTAKERETWKQLVTNLPPMPPEPEEVRPGAPMPPPVSRRVATNSDPSK